ncbi:hypothetical protein BRARA_D00001 [Brassica rapa]|uniref:Uncharacterized protein n=1 Tax=Brassica campestris TaxID=3711 RepID=A0A397ZGZ2_BRACM|nr:hypothetical protein BRARA_D00001 [Brassica rapa]
MENALLQSCGFICLELCIITLYTIIKRFQFSRSQRENIGCSRKQASHIDNIFEFYSFSIVHKSTVSDAVTLPSYLYTHELA